ncbi:MAG: hypothetical protein AB1690_06130 [Candidatus Zixiibacteriota bacterium]
MKRLWVYLIPSILFLSCGEEKITKSGFSAPHYPLLNEPLVLKVSSRIQPFAIDSNIYKFDLSQDSLARNGEMNDIQIFYSSITSCDDENQIYDFSRAAYRAFSPTFRYDACFHAPAPQFHLLSGHGIAALDCLDEDKKMMIKPTRLSSGFAMRAIQLHRAYRPISVANDSGFIIFSIADDGESYWLLPERGDELLRLAYSGNFLAGIPMPEPEMEQVAFDGEFLWVTDSKRCYRLSLTGERQGSFHWRQLDPGPITVNGSNMYMVRRIGPISHMYSIDIPASLAADSAVGDFRFTIYSEVYSLARVGSQFLVSVPDSARVINDSGKVMASYGWNVSFPLTISYYKGILSVLCMGPSDLLAFDQVIARFRVP